MWWLRWTLFRWFMLAALRIAPDSRARDLFVKKVTDASEQIFEAIRKDNEDRK